MRRKVVITPRLVARVARRVKLGERVRDLAHRLGLNKYGYERLCKAVRSNLGWRRLTGGRQVVQPASGGTPQKYRRHYDGLHGRGAAVRLIQTGAGRTFGELAQILGLSKSWTTKLWHGLGGPARRRGRPKIMAGTTRVLKKPLKRGGGMVNGNRRKAVTWWKQERPRTSRAGQRPVIKSRTGYDIGSYILVLVAVFLAGMLAGPWLFGPSKAMPIAVEQIQRELALLDEAAAMILFWERRHTRMWKAAYTRFDWTGPKLKRALVRLEMAQFEFKAVGSVLDQWGKESNSISILEERMRALRSRVASFCKEFGLDCPRGYPPDQATVRRDRYQALGAPGGFFHCRSTRASQRRSPSGNQQ